VGETGKRIQLSDKVKFRIRLAEKQGFLSQAGSNNKLQQWATAWLLNEDKRERQELEMKREESLFKTLLLLLKPEAYNAMFVQKDIEDDDVGVEIDPSEFKDIAAFLNGKQKITAADILNGGEWF
jgi:hypothetical protein